MLGKGFNARFTCESDFFGFGALEFVDGGVGNWRWPSSVVTGEAMVNGEAIVGSGLRRREASVLA